MEENEELGFNYFDDEEDYKESLKGVSVKDTQNGLEIFIMGTESGILGKYEVEMNIKGYTEEQLFNICYEVANRIRSKYYEVDELSRNDIVEIVRNQFIR